MALKIIYEILINRAWVIPLLCMAYGAMAKGWAAKHGERYKLTIPIVCIFISLALHLLFPQIDREDKGLIELMSDSVYDGLTAVGIYELYKNIRKFSPKKQC